MNPLPLALGYQLLLGPNSMIKLFQPRSSIPTDRKHIVPDISPLKDISNNFQFSCFQSSQDNIPMIFHSVVLA